MSAQSVGVAPGSVGPAGVAAKSAESAGCAIGRTLLARRLVDNTLNAGEVRLKQEGTLRDLSSVRNRPGDSLSVRNLRMHLAQAGRHPPQLARRRPEQPRKPEWMDRRRIQSDINQTGYWGTDRSISGEGGRQHVNQDRTTGEDLHLMVVFASANPWCWEGVPGAGAAAAEEAV